jgi:hypothetical protein
VAAKVSIIPRKTRRAFGGPTPAAPLKPDGQHEVRSPMTSKSQKVAQMVAKVSGKNIGELGEPTKAAPLKPATENTSAAPANQPADGKK